MTPKTLFCFKRCRNFVCWIHAYGIPNSSRVCRSPHSLSPPTVRAVAVALTVCSSFFVFLPLGAGCGSGQISLIGLSTPWSSSSVLTKLHNRYCHFFCFHSTIQRPSTRDAKLPDCKLRDGQGRAGSGCPWGRGSCRRGRAKARWRAALGCSWVSDCSTAGSRGLWAQLN